MKQKLILAQLCRHYQFSIFHKSVSQTFQATCFHFPLRFAFIVPAKWQIHHAEDGTWRPEPKRFHKGHIYGIELIMRTQRPSAKRCWNHILNSNFLATALNFHHHNTTRPGELELVQKDLFSSSNGIIIIMIKRH